MKAKCITTVDTTTVSYISRVAFQVAALRPLTEKVQFASENPSHAIRRC